MVFFGRLRQIDSGSISKKMPFLITFFKEPTPPRCDGPVSGYRAIHVAPRIPPERPLAKVPISGVKSTI